MVRDMTKPNLRYLTHPVLALRFIEWMAIDRLYAKPNNLNMFSLYEDEQRSMNRAEDYQTLIKKKFDPFMWLRDLPALLGTGKTLGTLDEFYAYCDQQILPARERRTKTQKAYQQGKLGDAFIDNPALISAIKKACVTWAADETSPEDIEHELGELEAEHCLVELTDAQRQTLQEKVLQPHLDKLLAPSRIERDLINHKDRRTAKNAAFLYLCIKSQCPVENTLSVSQKEYISWCGGNAEAWRKSCKMLVDIGALELVEKGIKGSSSRTATIYRRLV